MISIGRLPAGVSTVTCWPTRSPNWRSTEVPRTISLAVRGARPSSTVGDSSGPVPRATPIAGMTVAGPAPLPWWSMDTVPCTPKVTVGDLRHLAR